MCLCVHTSIHSLMAFLIPLAKFYSMILKSSAEKGSPCLIPDFSWKVSSVFTIKDRCWNFVDVL